LLKVLSDLSDRLPSQPPRSIIGSRSGAGAGAGAGASESRPQAVRLRPRATPAPRTSRLPRPRATPAPPAEGPGGAPTPWEVPASPAPPPAPLRPLCLRRLRPAGNGLGQFLRRTLRVRLRARSSVCGGSPSLADDKLFPLRARPPECNSPSRQIGHGAATSGGTSPSVHQWVG